MDRSNASPGPGSARGAPGYLQIADQLAARIRSGEMAVGSRVPSERELAADLAVSRIMTRQALQVLHQRGLVTRVQGVGTFVARPAVEYRGTRVALFSDEMRRQGLVPGSRVLRRDIVHAPAPIAQRLEVPIGSTVLAVVRHLSGSGMTIGIDACFHPLSRYPGMEDLDLTIEHDVLVARYDSRPMEVRRTIEARLATPDECTSLGLEPVAAVLEIEWTGWDQHGRPWGCGTEVYSGPATNITVTATTESDDPA